MTTRDAAQSITRAEKIRMQRADLDRTREQAATVNKPRMQVETPPVLLRGNTRSPVAQRFQQPHVRKKYSLPMGSFGAELVMPSLPEFRLGWRLVSGLIFATMIFVLFSMSAGSHYRIKQAAITGNQRVSSTDMNLVMGVIGKPIFMINLQDVKNTLSAAYPEFSEVSVSAGFPDQVNISVVEREPMIAWQMEGQTLWIDTDGVVFQARGEVIPQVTIQSKAIPPVQAIQIEQTETSVKLLPSQLIQRNGNIATINVHQLDKSLLDAAITLSQVVPAGVPLVYTQDHGLGWQAEQGWQTFVGIDLTEITAKMAMYESIVANLSAQGITPGMVSVEYLHAPYYRMERKEW
jgi:cell division septal protein FtsQ